VSAAQRPGRLGHAIGSLVAAAFVAVPVTAIVVGVGLWLIWPGHAQYLPVDLVCPPEYTNIVVARDTWQASDGGTAIDLAVFCQSPAGGVMRPGIWTIIWREAFVVWCVLVALFWLPQLLRGPRPTTTPAPASSPLTGSTRASEAARAMRLVLEHRAATEEALRRVNAGTHTPPSADEDGTPRPPATPRPTSTTSTTGSGGWASVPGQSLWRK
jgi:hypothetical protein